MVLVTFPAIDGLKPAWREAAPNLGATSLGYWRRVGIPVLAPSILGGILLLFANAFSAYATAYALSTGTSNLVTVQIRFFLQGNTITGKGQLGLRAGGVDDHHHGRLHDRLPAAAEEGRAMAASVTARRASPARHGADPWCRSSCSLAARSYFFLPLLAMARFAFQQVPMVTSRLVHAVRPLDARQPRLRVPRPDCSCPRSCSA